ncbi:hypothetical protein [Metabacillus niabensis]|uniref:hypothetical protein n=1 Tax=Metabacillus niabensis TaxID=324854 RepID=UPI0039A1C1C0
MNVVDRKRVIDVLNSLEVIESNGGDQAYLLVENSEKNRGLLNNVGITNEIINKYGDKETFCILSLGIREGFCDLYFDGKLIYFDESIVIESNDKSLIIFKLGDEHFLGLYDNGGVVFEEKITDTLLSQIKKVIN